VAKHYTNFNDYTLIFDAERHTFDCTYTGRGTFLESVTLQADIGDSDRRVSLSAFTTVDLRNVPGENTWGNTTYVTCTDGPARLPELTLRFSLDRDGLHLSSDTDSGVTLHLSGRVNWGTDPENATFAMCLGRRGPDLRAALGPAASTIDDCLFDRNTDSLVQLGGSNTLRLDYDWAAGAYTFSLALPETAADSSFSAKVVEDVYSARFSIPYKAINKHSTFPTPPVGWMTWYAVKFDAGEEKVLENARWQAENLGKYGANCVWVDWEWYHSSMKGEEEAGVDIFNPRPDAYPNGLAYVADEIRKLGMVPALWICPTCDTNINTFLEENPDAILNVESRWFGKYVIDPTHPKTKSEFIPKVFNTIKAWGYEAIKWDCDYGALNLYDRFHEDLHDPDQTSSQALRELHRVARDTVGKDYFLLACIGPMQRDLPLCVDTFDAARIGNDIFSWDDFMKNGVRRLYERYAYHNVLLYADPDNVVIRPEFNTQDQAVSRVSIVSLLGLPITFGDDLPQLPPERVELLKRIIPSVDAHPMDIDENSAPDGVVTTNLAISRPFEEWNVVSIFNPSDDVVHADLHFSQDLHLPAGGTYLAYDFWDQEYLGELTDSLCLAIDAFASRVVSLRRTRDVPQVVSTSRHITQGAHDIITMAYDSSTSTLVGRSRLVGGEEHVITFRVPSGYTVRPEPQIKHVRDDVYTLSIIPECCGDLDWRIEFQ
jgi:hypothetical protein